MGEEMMMETTQVMATVRGTRYVLRCLAYWIGRVTAINLHQTMHTNQGTTHQFIQSSFLYLQHAVINLLAFGNSANDSRVYSLI